MGNKEVRFIVYCPKAIDISLSGSFNKWNKMPMDRRDGGFWEIKIKLPLGVYEYSFFIDGKEVDNVSGCVEVNMRALSPCATWGSNCRNGKAASTSS